jgi:hypothetical protein
MQMDMCVPDCPCQPRNARLYRQVHILRQVKVAREVELLLLHGRRHDGSVALVLHCAPRDGVAYLVRVIRGRSEQISTDRAVRAHEARVLSGGVAEVLLVQLRPQNRAVCSSPKCVLAHKRERGLSHGGHDLQAARGRHTSRSLRDWRRVHSDMVTT